MFLPAKEPDEVVAARRLRRELEKEEFSLRELYALACTETKDAEFQQIQEFITAWAQVNGVDVECYRQFGSYYSPR